MDTKARLPAPFDGQILPYVKRRLHEFKGRWPLIAEETAVPYFTIANIASGKSKNPEVDSLQPLIDWFAKRDGEASEHQQRKQRA